MRPHLVPDCARCAGLCCVATHFDASDDFAITKPLGVPCPHLDTRDACAIHAERATRGFRGCLAYSCHGAGQRVTRALLAGGSWRDEEPARARVVFGVFRTVAALHELVALLDAAYALPLGSAMVAELDGARSRLSLDVSRALAGDTVDVDARREEVRRWLRSVGARSPGLAVLP